MALDTTLATSLNGSNLRVFHAVKIDLRTGETINLIDGSGFVSFSVDGVMTTFAGRAGDFGTLGNLSTVTEAIATEAPRMTITLYPPDAGEGNALLDINNQGSAVRVWFGLVDEMTGEAIGAPELLWAGLLDTAKVLMGEATRAIDLDVSSVFDRLFADSEGARLNGVWHKSIWPGETGLDHVVEAGLNTPWGMDAARPTVTTGRSGTGGGRVPPTELTGGSWWRDLTDTSRV